MHHVNDNAHDLVTRLRGGYGAEPDRELTSGALKAVLPAYTIIKSALTSPDL